MNVQKNEKGFSIIEVVLVLAIAALIFLMVFIALPALQRSQRDTARKNEASTIATAVTNYKSNHRGKFTDIAESNLNTEISQITEVKVEAAADPSKVPAVDAPDKVVVFLDSTCADNNEPTKQLRKAAIVGRTEGAGAQLTCISV